MGVIAGLGQAALKIGFGLFLSRLLTPNTESPTLDDTRQPSFDEGSPVPFVLGAGIRVPGQVIWQSEIREVGSDSGKKGGKGGSSSSTQYFVDLAVGFNRPLPLSGAEPIRALFAGGDKIFDKNVDTNISSAVVEQVARNTTRTILATPSCTNLPDEEFIDYIHDGAADGTNFFSTIRSGFDVTVSGATEAANNGTFRVVAVELDVDGVPGKSKLTVSKGTNSYFTVAGSPLTNSTCTLNGSAITPGVSDSAGDTLTFIQDLPEFNQASITSLVQYNGANTQDPDPTIEAVEGVDNYPAHRFTTYIVLTNFNLTKWGRTIPPMSAIIEESATRTVGEALGILVERCGLLTAADDVDTEGLDDIVTGFGVVNSSPPVEQIRQLMMIHQLGVREVPSVNPSTGAFDVKLQFYKLNAATEVTVAAADIGVHPIDEQPETEGLVVSGFDESTLLNRLTVKFQDTTRDYQPGSRTYIGEGSDGNASETISVAYALSPQDAEDLARREYWRRYLDESEEGSADLPHSYREISEGDIIVTTDPAGNARRLRADNVQYGANGMIKVRGKIQYGDFLNDTDFAANGEGTTTGGVTLPPELINCAVELPVLLGGDGTIVGMQWAVALASPNASFPGATGFISVDGGSSWSAAQSFLGTAITGVTASELGNNGILTEYWDNINTIDVTLDNPNAQLESSTDSLVLAGQNNWLLIGQEIVGFVNAALVSGRTYRLSRLLRGRRNTERFVDFHSTGEKCLLLTGGNVVFTELGLTPINSTVIFRIVPTGSEVTDAAVVGTEVRIAIEGMGIQPFGPTFLPVIRNAAGDIKFKMRYRSRLGFRMLGGTIAPILVSAEAYRLTILDNLGEIVRNIYFTGDEYTYTAADQTADFGGTQSSLDVIAYQLAGTVGLGRYTEATV